VTTAATASPTTVNATRPSSRRARSDSWGQLDHPAGPGHLERVLIKLQIGELEPTRGLPGDARAPQDDPQPRDQLLETEGLCNVVIPAGGEPADLVRGGVARAQKQDRHLGVLGRQATRDLKAIHVWQHHIQHHHVRMAPPDQVQRLPAGPGRLNPETVMTKSHRDDIDDARLIVDDEHTSGFRLTIHATIIDRDPEKNLGATT
jgi:hypothetical protein